MAEKWKHIGSAENALFSILPPRKELVENTETGEQRIVYVGIGQTVGEAIENGQFADKDE